VRDAISKTPDGLNLEDPGEVLSDGNTQKRVTPFTIQALRVPTLVGLFSPIQPPAKAGTLNASSAKCILIQIPSFRI
jgi:hypothetical protein